MAVILALDMNLLSTHTHTHTYTNIYSGGSWFNHLEGTVTQRVSVQTVAVFSRAIDPFSPQGRCTNHAGRRRLRRSSAWRNLGARGNNRQDPSGWARSLSSGAPRVTKRDPE
ncbi:uncharacterized protein LOC105699021 [Orussus abietinus]|uniref:uncharacterized protein LOC105699021 n=1 Tax=Orussus abietinus TaxID=222816 RepID=UPI0006265E6D|nr:uncharacterized protein LOC105699021 [Orussus abietinus]